jgi:hypothetical protein
MPRSCSLHHVQARWALPRAVLHAPVLTRAPFARGTFSCVQKTEPPASISSSSIGAMAKSATWSGLVECVVCCNVKVMIGRSRTVPRWRGVLWPRSFSPHGDHTRLYNQCTALFHGTDTALPRMYRPVPILVLLTHHHRRTITPTWRVSCCVSGQSSRGDS